jgi:hypothetical protein
VRMRMWTAFLAPWRMIAHLLVGMPPVPSQRSPQPTAFARGDYITAMAYPAGDLLRQGRGFAMIERRSPVDKPRLMKSADPNF